jgi:hypothetical protein
MNLELLDTIKINFIIGTGRSGTTLLVVLLNQLKNCIATPEIHHFIFFYKKYKNIDSISQQLIDDYKKYLTYYFNYKKNPLIGPQNNTLIAELKIGQKINYSQLTKLIYLGLFGNKGIDNQINIIIDKNPYYTLHADKILEVFPDAKLLALTRDYRGYILSNLQSQKRKVSKKNVIYHALVWNLYMRKIYKIKGNNSKKLKIVKYEDIVLDKEKIIKEILEFFNLKYSSELLNFHEGIKHKLEEVEIPQNNIERTYKNVNNLSTPINTKRLYAWRDELRKDEIEKADFISSKYAKEYNYQSESKISVFKKIIITFISIPSFIRVKSFEVIDSPKLHFYLRYKVNEK